VELRIAKTAMMARTGRALHRRTFNFMVRFLQGNREPKNATNSADHTNFICVYSVAKLFRITIRFRCCTKATIYPKPASPDRFPAKNRSAAVSRASKATPILSPIESEHVERCRGGRIGGPKAKTAECVEMRGHPLLMRGHPQSVFELHMIFRL